MKCLIVFIIWIIATSLIYGYSTPKEAFDYIHAGGAGLVALVLVGGFVFLTQLFLAPIRIDNDQEKQTLSLEKKIVDSKITEEKIAGLMKFRERFISEIFATVISDYDFATKSQLFKDIHTEAIK